MTASVWFDALRRFVKYLKNLFKYPYFSIYIEYLNTLTKYFFVPIWYLNTYSM